MTTYTRKCRRGSKVKKSMKLLNTKKGGSKQESHSTQLDYQMIRLKNTAERLSVLANEYPNDEAKYGQYNPDNLSNADKNPKAAIKQISKVLEKLHSKINSASVRYKETIPVERIKRYNDILSRMRADQSSKEIFEIWRHFNFVKDTPWDQDTIDYLKHNMTHKGTRYSPFFDHSSIVAQFKRRHNGKSLQGIEKPSSLQIIPKRQTPNPGP